jgi:hypothetical protein
LTGRTLAVVSCLRSMDIRSAELVRTLCAARFSLLAPSYIEWYWPAQREWEWPVACSPVRSSRFDPRSSSPLPRQVLFDPSVQAATHAKLRRCSFMPRNRAGASWRDAVAAIDHDCWPSPPYHPLSVDNGLHRRSDSGIIELILNRLSTPPASNVCMITTDWAID